MRMYKSPIEVCVTEMQHKFEERIEGDIIKTIHNYGISVDKDELIKALDYDRQQYEEGFTDGKTESLGIIEKQKEEINLMRSDLIEVSHNYEHIKRLYEEEKARVIRWQKLFLEAQKKLKSAKAEAIKEFTQRLKCGVPQDTGVIRCADVDNLETEILEEWNDGNIVEITTGQ